MEKLFLSKKFVMILKLYTIAVLIIIAVWSYMGKIVDPITILRPATAWLIPPFIGMAVVINARKKR